MTTQKNNDEIGWNEPLPPPKEFELLPEGDAQFEVLKLERVRKDMGKLGTCNVAVLHLLVASYSGGDSQPMECNLPLHTKTVFKLYQFFAAIGQYTHGDVENGKPFTPNWAKVVGQQGNCVLKHRAWAGKDGKERKSPDIDVFLDESGRTRASDAPRKVGPASDNLAF